MTPSITDRVLAYLKENPSTALEVARGMPAKRRHLRVGYTYYWGDWSFIRAEKAGIIKLDDSGRYHVVNHSSCQSEGWLQLRYRSKYHYFNQNGSLCGFYGPQEPDSNYSPDIDNLEESKGCKKCRDLLSARAKVNK